MADFSKSTFREHKAVKGRFRAIEGGKVIASSENQLCANGLRQVLKGGFDNPSVIAVGTGSSIATQDDIQLGNEVSNGRFSVLENFNQKIQIASGSITLIHSAFWQSTQGFSGAISEVGLFYGTSGFPLTVINSGSLVGRLLVNFTKSVGTDVTLVYELEFDI